ncbi:MAG: hypothetical protein AAGC46_09400 [Solirubrobacteraceae bacterium]|nr:hypothetical protein [Patulibacter sp.]
MTSHLDRLLDIAGAPTEAPLVSGDSTALSGLLERRNGFYALESALHVFGEARARDWNETTLWRALYGDATRGHWFFAEDVFGGQFSVTADGVQAWDPETGESEPLANDLEGWAEVLLADYAFWTGQPLAREWQQTRGPLSEGFRLLPKVPFVLGGDYAVENLRAVDAVSAMRIRAGYAHALRNAPDGTRISISY